MHAVLCVIGAEKREGVVNVQLQERGPASSSDISAWERVSGHTSLTTALTSSKVNMCTLPRELREFYRVTDGMFIRWTTKTPGSTDATPLGRVRISPIASLKRVVSEKDAADWAWAQTSGDDASYNVLKWPAFELDSSSSDIRVALVYFSQCAPMMMMMMMMMCQPI